MSPRNSETENDLYRLSPSRTPVRIAEARAGIDESPPLASDDLDDRSIDLEAEDDVSFMRAQRRVPVRRGALPKKAANRLKQALIASSVAGAMAAAAASLYSFGTASGRFRIESSDNIEISGVQNVPRVH